MKRTEVFTQLTIVILTVWLVLHSQANNSPFILWVSGFGADFRGYLELARGNAPNHWYKQYMAYPFMLFLPLVKRYGEMQAVYCWMGLLTASYMVLAHFLCKVKHGWLLSLVCLKVFWFSLTSGNLTPVLCVALLSPYTAWMAVLVKPHFIVPALFVLGMAYWSSRKRGQGRRVAV